MSRPTVGRDAWDALVLPVTVGLLVGACVGYAVAAWLQGWAAMIWDAADGIEETELRRLVYRGDGRSAAALD